MGNTIGPGSSFDVETLIIGGGPTGLGAAYRYFSFSLSSNKKFKIQCPTSFEHSKLE